MICKLTLSITIDSIVDIGFLNLSTYIYASEIDFHWLLYIDDQKKKKKIILSWIFLRNQHSSYILPWKSQTFNNSFFKLLLHFTYCWCFYVIYQGSHSGFVDIYIIYQGSLSGFMSYPHRISTTVEEDNCSSKSSSQSC